MRGSTDRSWFRALFEVDTRALAALRVALGLLLLINLIDRAGHLRAWHVVEGIYPLALARASSGPVLSLHLMSGDLAFQAALFAIAIVFALAFTLGWHTRIATMVSWALLVSLHHRNELVQDVGDQTMALVLFWCMFLPLGEWWSIDARLRGRLHAGRLCSFATAGLLLQPAWIVFFAGVSKLKSAPWREGDAIGTVLQNDTWLQPFGEVLLGLPQLVPPLTYGTIVAEIAAPLCLFSPIATRTLRWLGLLGIWGLFAGLGLCVELGLIPFVLPVSLLPFVPPDLWERVRPHRDRAAAPHPQGELRGWRRAPGVAAGVALVFVFVANLDAMTGRVRLIPDPVLVAANAAGLSQGWGMYAPPPTGRFRLGVRLLLDDGSQREVVVGARREGWPERTPWPPLQEVWDYYRGKVFLHENIAVPPQPVELAAFLSWVCRRWDAEPDSPHAREATLMKVEREPPGSEGEDGMRPVSGTEQIARLRCASPLEDVARTARPPGQEG